MESEGVKPTAPDMGKTKLIPFPKSALGKPGVSVGCKETYQPPEEEFLVPCLSKLFVGMREIL
jgi:hypothetical protein